MALSYMRLFSKRSLDLNHFRCLYTSNPTSIYSSVALLQSTTSCSPASKVSHDEKNMRLKRPMSPHLTIYQVQLTSMLSVTHRATGIILSTATIFIGLGTLFIPGGIPCFIGAIDNFGLPAALIFLTKLCLAYPLTYHYLNGIRHLAWDMGRFLTIKEVYSTGWAVVGLSSIAALALALL